MLRIWPDLKLLPYAFYAAAVLCPLGCGSGNNETKHEHTDNVYKDVQPSKIGGEPIALNRGDDEIVPVLNPIPPSLAVDRVLPEDPAAFRRQVMETLKKDPSADVISLVDVVLLLNPDDQEMREIRADLLIRQGLEEDAAVDLRQCCAKGRSSCCR